MAATPTITPTTFHRAASSSIASAAWATRWSRCRACTRSPRTWPDAERIVLTNVPVSTKAAPLNAILGGSGLVHGSMAYPVGTRSLGALWALGLAACVR